MSNSSKPGIHDLTIIEKIHSWYGDPAHQPIVAALVKTGVVENQNVDKPRSLDVVLNLGVKLAEVGDGSKALNPSAGLPHKGGNYIS